MDWLEKYGDAPLDDSDQDTKGPVKSNTEQGTAKASPIIPVSLIRAFDLASMLGFFEQSLKCADCDKVFATEALASYHADKSGHLNFQESTEEVIMSFLLLSQDITCFLRTEASESLVFNTHHHLFPRSFLSDQAIDHRGKKDTLG